mgnify:CR=1 FL=1
MELPPSTLLIHDIGPTTIPSDLPNSQQHPPHLYQNLQDGGVHVIPLSQDMAPPIPLQHPVLPKQRRSRQTTLPPKQADPTHHPQHKPPHMRPILKQSKQYPITKRHATHKYNTRARYSQAANFLATIPSVHQANAVIDPNTGFSLEYRHLVKGDDSAIWTTGMANELGRLAQGVGTRMPTGTNTIFFCNKSQIPNNKFATYGRIVASL